MVLLLNDLVLLSLFFDVLIVWTDFCACVVFPVFVVFIVLLSVNCMDSLCVYVLCYVVLCCVVLCCVMSSVLFSLSSLFFDVFCVHSSFSLIQIGT